MINNILQSSNTLPSQPKAIFSTLQEIQKGDTKPIPKVVGQRIKNANAQLCHDARTNEANLIPFCKLARLNQPCQLYTGQERILVIT